MNCTENFAGLIATKNYNELLRIHKDYLTNGLDEECPENFQLLNEQLDLLEKARRTQHK